MAMIDMSNGDIYVIDDKTGEYKKLGLMLLR